MNRNDRWSKRSLSRDSRRRALLDFELMEGRMLLSMTSTVTNTNPTGAGSLYDAITRLNMDAATDSSPNIIQFDIAASGARTIALTQQLPDIIQPTDIQGYTEPGSSANTHPLTMGDNAVLTVIVSGGGTVQNGLIFDTPAAGSSVEGLNLAGFMGIAISVNSDNTAVTGNFIGVGTNGVPTSATTNVDGVLVSAASGDTIGGTAAADRNVITGDTYEAVVLAPIGAVYSSNDAIEGNFIGTNADLSMMTNPALRNDFGVLIYPSAGDSVGGTAAGSGNVISGNITYGVGTQDSTGLVLAGDLIQANGTAGVLLISNIGASITSSTIGGTAAGQGNPSYGIYLEGSTNTTIGGTAAGAGELIAANGANGITVDATSSGAMVAGSTISGNTGDGINFAGQNGSSLSGEVVVDDLFQSNTSGGLLITDAPGTTVTSSTIGGATSALGNSGFGVSASGSANVSLRDLTVSHDTADGIDVGTSPGAILSGDTVGSNGGVGVLLTTSGGASITSSTLGGTAAGLGNGGAGILLVSSTGATIGGTLAGAGVAVEGNAGDGIDFDATSTAGQVVGAMISGNAGVGVNFLGTAASTLSGEGLNLDTIATNRKGGVLITDAPGATLTTSTIGGTSASADGNGGFGVSVVGSSGVLIGSATVIGNQGPGIAIEPGLYVTNERGSNDATVQGSTISGNLGDGVQVYESGGVVLTGDTVQSNLGNGILIPYDSNQVKILSSTIGGTLPALGNGGDGISVSASTLLTANADLIEGNGGSGISLTNGSGVPTITSTTIGGTSLSNPPGLANGGYGILISNSSGAVIGGVGVGDVVDDNAAGGILFEGSNDDGEVLGSRIDDNGGVGVAYRTTTAPLLIDDSIISNAGGGLLLANCPGAAVESDANGQALIETNGGYGVSMSGSSNATVGGSTMGAGVSVTGNVGVGIAINTSDGSSVIDSAVMGNQGDGIDVLASTGVSLIGDTVTKNTGGGISASNGSTATIGVALVTENGSSGIGAVGSGIQLATSTITGNSGVGVSIIEPTSAPTVTDTTIQSNVGGGFLLAGSTVGGSIVSSTIGGTTTAQGNGGYGVSIAGSSGVIIGTAGAFSTLVSNNMGAGISATNSTMLTLRGLVVVSNRGAGIALSSSSGAVISHDFAEFDQGDGIDLNISTAALQGDVASSNSGAGILLSRGSAATIDDVDALMNGSTGIGAVSSAIRLSIATIVGNGGVGLSIIAPTNPTTPNSGLALSGLTIESNVGGGISLANDAVGGSISSAIIGGATAGLGNRGVGISLASSPGVQVAGDYVAGNAGDGIAARSSTGVAIRGSAVLDNSGAGIALSGGSDGASLAADAIMGNVGSGVSSSDSSGLTIGGGPGSAVAIVGNRGAGIAASGGANLAILGDTIEANRAGGIALESVSGGVAYTVVGGVDPSGGNGGFGIWVQGSPGFGLGGNVVLSNAGPGIVVSSGSNGASIVGGQVSGNAGAGVVVSGSAFAGVGSRGAALPVTGNRADGLDIGGSPGVTIVGVEAGNDEGIGIDVVGSPGTKVGGTGAGVVVHGSGGDGIDLSGSAGCSVVETNAAGNAGDGLDVTSPRVAVDASNFYSNAGSGLVISGPANSGAFVAAVAAINNQGFGILILNSPNNIIGLSGLGDLIEFNASTGLEITGPMATNNVVQYDTIVDNGPPVDAAGVKVRISPAFSGRRPISP